MNMFQPNPELAGILPCGGKGTRFESITGDLLPKSLYPVGGRELIRYTTDVLKPEVIGKLVFAVDHKADDIRQWANGSDLPHEIDFSEQTERGVLGAIVAGVEKVHERAFVACNTDEIRMGLDIEELIAFHDSHGAMGTMVTTYANQLSRHRLVEPRSDGLIIGSRLKPQEYAESPDQTGLVNTGFLVLDTEAADLFDPGYSHDWGGIIDPLCEAGQLYTYISPQLRYFNVGTPEELHEAEEYLEEHA